MNSWLKKRAFTVAAVAAVSALTATGVVMLWESPTFERPPVHVLVMDVGEGSLVLNPRTRSLIAGWRADTGPSRHYAAGSPGNMYVRPPRIYRLPNALSRTLDRVGLRQQIQTFDLVELGDPSDGEFVWKPSEVPCDASVDPRIVGWWAETFASGDLSFVWGLRCDGTLVSNPCGTSGGRWGRIDDLVVLQWPPSPGLIREGAGDVVEVRLIDGVGTWRGEGRTRAVRRVEPIGSPDVFSFNRNR